MFFYFCQNNLKIEKDKKKEINKQKKLFFPEKKINNDDKNTHKMVCLGFSCHIFLQKVKHFCTDMLNVK